MADKPQSTKLNPGDVAPPGTPATGEGPCPDCQGKGQRQRPALPHLRRQRHRHPGGGGRLNLRYAARMQLPPGSDARRRGRAGRGRYRVLPEGLEVFNEAALARPPALGGRWRSSCGREGRIVGGLVGQVYAGWLFIRFFWLADELRRHGLGAGFIAAAEERARERGCHSAYVDTFSFQAPGFYQRQGYVEFARLPYPPKGERIWLRKPLTEDAP